MLNFGPKYFGGKFLDNTLYNRIYHSIAMNLTPQLKISARKYTAISGTNPHNL